MKNFSDLGLAPSLLDALSAIGYETPTPIQSQAIPIVLEGHDLLGIAQTGTGKTAAFCLPLLQKIIANNQRPAPKHTHALILTPTRELAIQIHENLCEYGSQLRKQFAVIYGGVPQGRQVQKMRQGVDILVATPGRLIDLIGQGHVKLSNVETFILDEADRMLDMGFMPDIKRILKLLPKKRHNLFFSATMPDDIQKLSKDILDQPKKVEITPESTTIELIDQSVMYVHKTRKIDLLLHFLKTERPKKVLVFVGMKYLANRISARLEKAGIPSMAIHGNKAQGARQRAIKSFADGKIRVLIATDVASRGIDIDDISHVINYDLPSKAESYVHRIGRTARAGKEGIAIAFVTAEEKVYLVQIEKSIRKKIDVIEDQPFHSEAAMCSKPMKAGKAKAAIESNGRRGRHPFKKNSKKAGPKKNSSRKEGEQKSYSKNDSFNKSSTTKKKTSTRKRTLKNF